MSVDVGAIRASLATTGVALTKSNVAEFEALANALGRSVAARLGGPSVDLLAPTEMPDAAARSLSAIHDMNAFPFHTDAAHHRLPPRYLLMRLADGSATETPTLLREASLEQLADDDAKTLAREPWLIRGGRGRTFYAPIVDRVQGFIRFDPGCMTAPAGTSLTGQEILRRLLDESPSWTVSWLPGTTLAIDNWRILHSRPAVAISDRKRLLMRTLRSGTNS